MYHLKAEPTTTRKFQLIGDDPDLFELVDSWVLEVSQKRYKSLKKIVGILVRLIEEEPFYRGREDLAKIRAFFRWVTENIRFLNYTNPDLKIGFVKNVLSQVVNIRKLIKFQLAIINCVIVSFSIKSTVSNNRFSKKVSSI